GTALPQLLVNAFGAASPTVTTVTPGGGSLKIGSSMTGTGAARKERKGRLELAGDNQAGTALTNTIVVNEGELVVSHANALGTTTANTHVFIGNNGGGAAAAKVVYASTAGTDQIITGANVTVNRSGQYDFGGVSDQFSQLIVIDGSVVNSGTAGTVTASAGLA